METKIVFRSFDGTILNGIFQSPVKKDVRGGVLLLHGCPSEKNEWGFYSDMAKFLEDNLFASFRFDYREQGENDKTENMENLTLSGMISDTESGYHELINLIGQGLPIFVVGTSFAGGLAIKWINAYKREVKRLFLMAPLLDVYFTITKAGIVTKDNHGADIIQDKSVRELNEQGFLISGGKKMNKAFINEVLMMNLDVEMRILKCDFDVFHGTKDTIVPFEHSTKYLKLAGKGNLIPVENADHGFAVENDDDLTFPGTKENHYFVYKEMVRRMAA